MKMEKLTKRLFIAMGKLFCVLLAERQYKAVKRSRIKIPQWTRIFKVNCCLKVHNAHLKLASPISG